MEIKAQGAVARGNKVMHVKTLIAFIFLISINGSADLKHIPHK